MRRALLWSIALTALTAIALTAALLLANFGASRWWFALLLAVPLTIGLPATCGILACAALWNGPPLWAFALLAVAAGSLCQLLGAGLIRRWAKCCR
jgi:hypothetical protein